MLAESTPNLSEYSVKPTTVIVHNPITCNALGQLKDCSSVDELQEQFLFREFPDDVQFVIDHLEFVKALRQKVAKVLTVADVLGDHIEEDCEALRKNPNQVYTRDAVITLPWVKKGYIAGNMRKKIRHGEPDLMKKVCQTLNMDEMVQIPKELHLEGGDVIPLNYDGRRALLIGFGRRTDYSTLQYLRDSLIPEFVDEIIGIFLAEWRINLDGGMCPVSNNTLLAHEKSLVSGVILSKTNSQLISPVDFFRKIGFQIVPVTKNESIYQQACNVFCLGEMEIISYDLCTRVKTILEKEHDIKVNTIPGRELVKGTGGPRCMTRPIY